MQEMANCISSIVHLIKSVCDAKINSWRNIKNHTHADININKTSLGTKENEDHQVSYAGFQGSQGSVLFVHFNKIYLQGTIKVFACQICGVLCC